MASETRAERETVLGPDSVVTAKRNLLCCEVNSESIILDGDSGVYFGLNEVGSRIWELIQEPTTLGAARDALLGEFDVAGPECERALYDFVRELDARGLVEVVR
jgi:hypothetical protein